MKKLISGTLITIITIGVFIWIVPSDFEFGKYDDFQEAIQKGIPYKVNNIIYSDQYDHVSIVLYTTNPDKGELPLANYEALGVAFFKGSDEKGWENVGPNGWEHYENDNMTVYTEAFRESDTKGNMLREFYVVFGEVNNEEIIAVETKSKEVEKFKKAKFITAQGNDYYFQIGKGTIVRGLSKSGEVIDRQGS